jgi:hypothetical protein
MPKVVKLAFVAASTFSVLLAASMGSNAHGQSEYPSSFGIRAGTGAYGTFDVEAGKTQPIVNMNESTPYRVCIVGKRATVITEKGETTGLDHGDCYDVESKTIDIRNDSGDDDIHGIYQRLSPGGVVNRGAQ